MSRPPLPSLRAALALPAEGWRRNQAAVNIAAGLVFFGFTLVMPFLPLYVAELGVVGVERIAFWSGLLLSAPPLLAALLGPFWGRIAERTGMKLMVGRVLITMTVIWALMYFAENVTQVLILRIVLGIFSGFSAMSAALVTQGCPHERIGRAIGTLQATQILSTAAGPFAGGLLYALVGIRNAFLVTSACCAFALILILILYRDSAATAHPAPGSLSGADSRGSRWKLVRSLPGFLPLIPFLFLVNLVDRCFPTVIPLVVQSMVGDDSVRVATSSGLIVTSYALAAAASAYVLGHVAARRRPAGILVGVLSGSALLTALMVLCRTPTQFLVLRVLAGILAGGALTLGFAAAGPLIPPHRRASLYGILSSASLLGGAVGPLASGILVAIHLRAPFVAAALTYAGLVLWVMIRLRDLPAAGAPEPALATRPVNQV
ncbi:MAG TPA: MFS transporter [Candidatus Polarisedimenticolia bacterium]|nr:MFS transporter [Candidatus Polarisedimenticolia bacterium]